MKKSTESLATQIKSFTAKVEWLNIDTETLDDEVVNALRSSRWVAGLQFTRGLREYYYEKLIDILRDNIVIKKVKILHTVFPTQDPMNKDQTSLNKLLMENNNLRKILAMQSDNPNELIIANGKLLFTKEFQERAKEAKSSCWTSQNTLTKTQSTKLAYLLSCNTFVQKITIRGQDDETTKKTFFPHLAFNTNLAEINSGQTTTLTIWTKLSAVQKNATIQLILENRVTEIVLHEHDWDLLAELPWQTALANLSFRNVLRDDQPLERLMANNISITTLSSGYNYANDPQDLYINVNPKPKSLLHLNCNKFLANCAISNPIELRLENAILTAKKTMLICEKMNAFSSLQTFKVSSVAYEECDALLSILESFHHNAQIQLRQLDFSNLSLSDKAFDTLLLLVESKPDLTRLSLRNVKLDKMKFKQLCTLLTKDIPLSHLDLSQTQLNNELVHNLSVALESNRKIVSLNLSQNSFDMTGIAALKSLLQKNHFIHTLILESSCLTGPDAKQFANDIKKSNCSLTDLSLSHTEKVSQTTVNEKGVKTVISKPYYNKYQDAIDSFTNANRQKRDSLLNYVWRGETAFAEKALSQRISPNCCDTQGDTPLHITAREKPINQDMVRLFVSQGANTRIMNNAGQTPFDFLDSTANADIIAILNGNSVANKKRQPTQSGPITRYFAPKQDHNNKRERDSAASEPDQPEVGTVKQAKTNNEVAPPDDVDINAIYIALVNNRIQTISQMVNAHNCHLHFSDGNLLLHIATFYQARECVEYLLQIGADPNRSNALGQLPIHIACLNLSNQNGLKILNLLLSANPQTANSIDQFGLTPLYCLTGGFNDQMRVHESDGLRALAAKQLLESHAELQYFVYDYLTHEKMTVLHKAIARRCYRLTKVLLMHNTCDPTIQDSHGWSPLHHAVFQGNLTIIARLLVHPQILLDQPDQTGTTPRQLARNMNFAADVSNQEYLKEQINKLFEQRSLQQFPQSKSGIYWAKELTIRYGSRYQRNHDLLLPFEAEHSRLQSMAGANRTQGNYLTASLTFIVSKGKHQPEENLPRTHITIKLIFTDKFHVTDAWESRERIDTNKGCSIIKKIERSPDALHRILNRLSCAPTDVRQSASKDINSTDTCLSEIGIQTLFYMPDIEVGEYNFEQRFHHSEQALFDHLQDPELIDQILTALQESSDFQTGCKVYAVILNAFSKCYMCPDCMASTLGFQNTAQGDFFKILKQKLAYLQCALPKTGNLKSITLFSADFPTKHQQKVTSEQHIAYDAIDLRTVNNNIILTQDAGESKPKGTTYHSRKG